MPQIDRQIDRAPMCSLLIRQCAGWSFELKGTNRNRYLQNIVNLVCEDG